MGRVIDVGAGKNPAPVATDTLDKRPCADYQADLEDEWPLPDNSADGVIARHVVEHLNDPEHFFSEAARVLVVDGWLRVTVPLGEDAKTDHDHETEWRYCTPEQFSRSHRRGWDPDVPLDLVDREIKTWLGGPFRFVSPLLQLASRRWPAWAAHRCYAGELTATFRRVKS